MEPEPYTLFPRKSKAMKKTSQFIRSDSETRVRENGFHLLFNLPCTAFWDVSSAISECK